MSVHCHVCGSKDLRPSRFQPGDLVYLLTLRHPVRCRDCRRRFCVSILHIRKVKRDARMRRTRRNREMRMPQSVLMDWKPFEDLR